MELSQKPSSKQNLGFLLQRKAGRYVLQLFPTFADSHVAVQVRFVFETFCKLHPGMPLMHLHGKQKQATRLGTCAKFTTTKNAALFATDLAARGLDFPSVDWVLQIDAPEDADTYIHRVGRTARYESKGKGLLFLCPSEEEGMLAALAKKKIKIEQIKIKGSKTQSIEKHLQNLAFQDPEIKYLGQKVNLIAISRL
jgi:ATP-dependent RNA helicase DDX10/DBP4